MGVFIIVIIEDEWFKCFPVSHSDGTGRSGTYILIDMVLNRMAKGKRLVSLSSRFISCMLIGRLSVLGVKEIDIAATLEHIRDQRPSMVRTKVCTKCFPSMWLWMLRVNLHTKLDYFSRTSLSLPWQLWQKRWMPFWKPFLSEPPPTVSRSLTLTPSHAPHSRSCQEFI